MNETDIKTTIALMDEMWADRFAPIHKEALSLQIRRLPINADQARAALMDCWANQGRMASSKIITSALVRAAYGDKSPVQSRSEQQREAKEQEFREKERQAEIDDADTLRWLKGLTQADVDVLVRHVRDTAAPLYAAWLNKGGRGEKEIPVTLADARTNHSVRGVLHAAERQLVRTQA